uniref:DUF1844 domain-containing protein n=1 Tax=Euplotes harpa TaxID=151035 RepID=A0A7S3N7C8_9SPIT|mmetsp:Transcript_19784/g.22959  ORF Transcript_19784/g.22959 Transcript_19784/m.22959 type:complete len:107 (+) Transcript_19784:580-900(+)
MDLPGEETKSAPMESLMALYKHLNSPAPNSTGRLSESDLETAEGVLADLLSAAKAEFAFEQVDLLQLMAREMRERVQTEGDKDQEVLARKQAEEFVRELKRFANKE